VCSSCWSGLTSELSEPPPACQRLFHARSPAAPCPDLVYALCRCDKELGRLQHQVDLRADRVRREAAAGEAAYKAQVAGLEAQWGEARAAFADLEGRMNRVTQAATKIGNRLQNADLYRRRALDAVEAVERLQEFAHASDPSHLGPLFHDNTRLAEAAATTGKLLAVTQDLISARERVGLAGQRRPAGEAPQVVRPGGAAGTPLARYTRGRLPLSQHSALSRRMPCMHKAPRPPFRPPPSLPNTGHHRGSCRAAGAVPQLVGQPAGGALRRRPLPP
jgi:hypothetical protein